jgi:hypothetical protein
MEHLDRPHEARNPIYAKSGDSTIRILFVTFLVVSDIFRFVHTMCCPQVTAVWINTLAKVPFECTLMPEIYRKVSPI